MVSKSPDETQKGDSFFITFWFKEKSIFKEKKKDYREIKIISLYSNLTNKFFYKF